MFTNTTKSIVAALVLVTASVTFASSSYAAPRGVPDAEKAWMDRASQNTDGGNGG